MKILKIEWAPLRVPLHRRLETLSAGSWIFIMLFGEIICLFIYLWCLFKGGLILRSVILLYTMFLIQDRETGENGGRGQGSEWFRGIIWWRFYQNYFPVKIVKTVDLPADKNYLFATFPHGVLSSATFANFATGGTNFKELFPGIRSKVLTLNFHFYIPLFREVLLSWGVASVSARSLYKILTADNTKYHPSNRDGYTSNAAIIMIGGAQEALNCRPNNYAIILKKRKGFVKMAIRTGASIVPVFNFGEVDIFDQPANPPGSLLRKFQETVKKITGVAPACFVGRGFFQYSFGMIPRRAPLTTVVGAPIDTVQKDDPTAEEVDKLHGYYTEALEKLFEANKSKYVKDYENVKLVIE